MTAPNLVLSIFPGIDLLGRAFEEEWPECMVVRGPDLLWGGDVKRFHIPRNRFDGLIGGPPCQWASRMVHMIRKVHGEAAIAENLIPEYLRLVDEGQPFWFVMENAKDSPAPMVDGYRVDSIILNNRQFGQEQNRERRVSFGSHDDLPIARYLDLWTSPINGTYETAVLSTSRTVAVALDRNHRPKPRTVDAKPRTIGDLLRLQGFPETLLDDAPFTEMGKRQAIANGVPLPMGRAIARAVKRALEAPDGR